MTARARAKAGPATSAQPPVKKPAAIPRWIRSLIAKPVRRVSELFLALVVLVGFVLWWIPRESRFSAELFVSEAQLVASERTPLLPATLVTTLDLDGFAEIRVPWAHTRSGAIAEERAVAGSVSFRSLERPINVAGLAVPRGAHVLLAATAARDQIRIAVRVPDETANDGTAHLNGPTIEVSLGGEVRVVGRGIGPDPLDFGTSRGASARPGEGLWSVRLTLAEPERQLLYPALALSSVGFQVSDDLVDSRERGRLGESSLRSGTIHIHGIDGGSSALHSREEFDLSHATDLYVDEVECTPRGLRIALRGLAKSIAVNRQGKRLELVPNWFQYTYRTESGRLAITVLVAFAVVVIQFLIELSNADAGRKSPS